MKLKQRLLPATLGLAAAGAVAFVGNHFVSAADHNDPPSRTDPAVASNADKAADIGDIYAWHSAAVMGPVADQSLNLVLTYGGPVAPSADQMGLYDRDVLYTLHISNDGDATTDEMMVHFKFGQDDSGRWMMRVMDAPGTTAPLEGMVETELAEGQVKAWVGLRDDPFFFDLEGFQETLATGLIAFNSFVGDPMMARDSFAGANITAFVLQVPLAEVVDDPAAPSTIDIWASTSRISQ